MTYLLVETQGHFYPNQNVSTIHCCVETLHILQQELLYRHLRHQVKKTLSSVAQNEERTT